MRFYCEAGARAGCIHATFGRIPDDAALGWWGIISFFITPVILVMNVLYLRHGFLLKPSPIDPPDHSGCDLISSNPSAEILQRLLGGERLQTGS